MPQYDRDGNPIDPMLDPNQSRTALLNGLGDTPATTDPSVKAPKDDGIPSSVPSGSPADLAIRQTQISHGQPSPIDPAQKPFDDAGLGLQGKQQQIGQWYQQYLGRTPSQTEVNSQLGNPGGMNAVRNLIQMSSEANSYAKAQATNSPTSSNPGSDRFSTGADATNGFGGVTYAGFSPQDHQGANLFDPMQAKYALQQYMVQNGALAGGAGGNAQQIADALNQMYGKAYGNDKFFTAQDAETILMPDGQYVHAAPNGYGMQKGTYNPDNQSEVFWGYQNGDPVNGGTDTGKAVPGNLGNDAVAIPAQSQGVTDPNVRSIASPSTATGPTLQDLMQQSQGFFDQQSAASRAALLQGLSV